MIREIYEKALDRDIDQLLKTGDDDFSFAIPGLSRFRVSAYKQRGSLAAVIRVIAFRLPDYKQLRIPNQQRQIMIQLASVLQAVISQQLIPTMDGTLIPVFEIMEVTPAIRNMIRENKVHQIDGLIYSSTGSGMISMDQSLINLYKEGKISKETAILYASNSEMITKRIR